MSQTVKGKGRNSGTAPVTPMMVQFNAVKEQFPDSILFFRMGDFYEMFGEDAVTASKILGIALTSRNKNAENQLPMCGVPHHSHKQYMVKLIKAGYKVAICDQLEDPALAKGIVKRGVTRVVSPGTVIDEEELPDSGNNFLVAVYQESETFYVAAADISTGEVYLTLAHHSRVADIIHTFQPKELLLSAPLRLEEYTQIRRAPKTLAKASASVAGVYGLSSDQSLGLTDSRLAVALEMIISYVNEAMLDISYARPREFNETDRLVLDQIAVKTLEIVESSGGKGSSLFSVLNYTSTPMGARLLKRRMLNPIRNRETIERRLDIIGYFVNKWSMAQELEKLLSGLYDIERIANRVASRRVNARELIWLRDSLADLPRIGDILESSGHPDVSALGKVLGQCEPIERIISSTLVDAPPVTLKEGDLIREGHNNIIDELRYVKNNGRQMVAALEAKLKGSTGINQLKVSYNKVFGYFIEVSKSNASKVPVEFERKQTLVNAERYVTPELKELENTILNAEERLSGLEYDIFCSLRDMVAEGAEILRAVALSVAELDVHLSLAHAAVVRGYCRPVIDDSGEIEVTEARHPVVEANIKDPFVANDINLDSSDNRLMLITGPNMAGKSTYIRSVAIVALMAHMGSFVPAASARIGILDRIFTWVGANDNISRGESTFMVEMVETANILSHATSKSLIILDEIGRGTATFDGVSIAWAVTEYILHHIRAKTLFATHYHELTEIASPGSGAANYTIMVKEAGGEIIFMRKIIRGSADRSYGIYVGQLAGLPSQVINRAEQVLKELEDSTATEGGTGPTPHRITPHEVIIKPMIIFDDSHPVMDKIKNIEVDTLTPVSALNLVSELKALMDNEY